jgi:plasmid stabilization system protein ParE
LRRRIRYTAAFLDAVAAQNKWLKKNRTARDRQRLRAALGRFRETIAANPHIGFESEKVGSFTVRAFTLSGLPFLIWYSFDESDPKGAIWFLMLWHESQDRVGVSPTRYMP